MSLHPLMLVLLADCQGNVPAVAGWPLECSWLPASTGCVVYFGSTLGLGPVTYGLDGNQHLSIKTWRSALPFALEA